MARRSREKDLPPTGISNIVDPIIKRESEWLVSNGFPDDLHRAVKIAVAELGDFATSDDVGEMPLNNIWELLQTCVDRRIWLANFARNQVRQNTSQETSPDEPPYLGVRFHPGSTISRDGYENKIEITAPTQYKIVRFIHSAGERGRTKSEMESEGLSDSLKQQKNAIKNSSLLSLDLDFKDGEHKLIHRDRSKD